VALGISALAIAAVTTAMGGAGGQPPQCSTSPTFAIVPPGQPFYLPPPLCYDPEGDPLTFTVVSGPAHGSLAPAPGGTWYYTPNPGFTGHDVLGITANDGTSDSNVFKWTMVVQPTPTGPPPPVKSFVVPPTKLRAALREGSLDLNSVCRPEPLEVRATVGIDKRTARRARLGRRALQVASGRGTCPVGGNAIELRFTRTARERLRALRTVKFKLVVKSAGQTIKTQTISLGPKAHSNLDPAG